MKIKFNLSGELNFGVKEIKEFTRIGIALNKAILNNLEEEDMKAILNVSKNLMKGFENEECKTYLNSLKKIINSMDIEINKDINKDISEEEKNEFNEFATDIEQQYTEDMKNFSERVNNINL